MGFVDRASPITIVSALTSLPMPPTSFGVLPSWWNRDDGTIGEFDLDLWGSADASLTNAEIVAAIQHPLTYADNAMTSVDHTTDRLTKVAHALKTGDGPLRLQTAGVLPLGLPLATDVWSIRVDANTLMLADSLANALSGIQIQFTDNGTGAVTIVDTPDTGRIYWHSYGALQTPIALTADRAFSVRSLHRSNAVAYGLVGSLSAGTISAAITPVLEV